jgi:hypothetical protein
MEQFSKELLDFLSVGGPIGVVVLTIFWMIKGIVIKFMEYRSVEDQRESESRSDFRNIMKEQQDLLKKQQHNDMLNIENNSKLLKLFEEHQEQVEYEKKMREVKCHEHKMRIVKYANIARESNKFVFECPNCKFRAETTEENIDNIIKEVE